MMCNNKSYARIESCTEIFLRFSNDESLNCTVFFFFFAIWPSPGDIFDIGEMPYESHGSLIFVESAELLLPSHSDIFSSILPSAEYKGGSIKPTTLAKMEAMLHLHVVGVIWDIFVVFRCVVAESDEWWIMLPEFCERERYPLNRITIL